MHTLRFHIKTLALLFSTIFIGCAVSSCSSDNDDKTTVAELILNNEIPAAETSQFIEVRAEGPWRLSIQFEDEADEWCRLRTTTGTGNRNDIALLFSANISDSERTAFITLETAGATITERIVQLGTGDPGGNPDPELSIELQEGTAPANDPSQFIRVTANGEWTISLVYPEGGPQNWAEVNPSSGVGNKDDVLFSYSENTSETQDRTVTLVLQSGNKTVESTFTQLRVTGQEEEVVKIELTKTPVEATETTQTINVKCLTEWTLTLQYPSGTSAWCTLNTTSGTGSQTITISYEPNTMQADRTVTIILTSVLSGKTDRVTLTQIGRTQVPSLPAWLELPDMSTTDPNTTFVTHHTTINNRTVRNYSLLYDTKEYLAYWVAYPLHTSYIGSSGRTNAWAYDPLIPTSQQPNLSSGISGYDRGHQIPSADRTSDRETNKQTFYYSNITPQLGRLNQYKWANLEGQVRGWLTYADRPDTLYVVTGAILKTVGGNETVKYVTKGNVQMAVPNYYYKVLLHRRNDTYRSIGFWFEHRDYGSGNATRSETKTVREIERLTGFDFFSNLPQSVQDQIETEIVYSAWGL